MSRASISLGAAATATTFLMACSFASLEGFSRVDGENGGDGAPGTDATSPVNPLGDGSTTNGDAGGDGSGPTNESGAKATYPEEVLADGPVGYYRFTESSGPLVDLGSTNAAGTIKPQVVRGVPGPIPGDTAIRNDGTAPAVLLGDDFDFAGRDAFSLEAWIKVKTTIGDPRGVVGKKQAGVTGYSFWVSSAALGFGRYLDLTDEEITTAVPASSVWTHVAGTYDGTKLKLYVNGALVNEGTSTLSLPDRSAAFAIGAKGGDSGSWFDGDIDEVAVYDKALSAQRIAAHHAAVPVQ